MGQSSLVDCILKMKVMQCRQIQSDLATTALRRNQNARVFVY